MPEELNIRISEDFKRLADQLQDAIYRYDVASRTFLFMNKSSGNLYDFDDSEFARVVTPKTVLLHIHPEDRDAVRKVSADSLTPGFESGEIEYRFLHHDGSIRWMHDRWMVLRDASGAATAIEGIVRDITRLKETEKALREYEQRFRRIAEVSPFAISIIDAHGRYVYLNRKFVELFGYTLEDIPTGREWFRRAFPDPAYGRQALTAWISDIKAGVEYEVDPREFRVTCKDGALRHVKFRPVVLGDGTLFIMYEDLTERRLTEERLRTSEERYRGVVQNIGVGVAVIGRNMEILSMNRQMETWFPHVDMSKEPICYESFNHPPGKELCSYCPTCRTLRDGGVYESVTETPVGDEIRNYRVVSSPLTDDRGHVTAAIEMVDDITDRQRAEEMFFKAFRMNPLPVSLSRTEDAYYLDINEAFLELFGFRREEVVGHNAFDLNIWVDRADRMRLVEALEAGKPVSGMEVRLCTRAGEPRIGRVFSEIIDLGGKPCLLSIYEDVTKRKHAEKEIRRLSRELINTQERTCKQLARDLHDECGQALTALHLGMEALQGALPHEFETQKQRIHELTGLVERLGDTIRNISHELRPEMLDDLGLVPALAWYVEEFMRRATGLKVDFAALGFKRRLDPALEIALYRMVQEGLTNIAKHSKARHADVFLTQSHPNVILTIRDDGVGLGDESSASNRGIGLLGMRERVASLGGVIEIRSRKGKGTVLRAELPVAARDAYAQDTHTHR